MHKNMRSHAGGSITLGKGTFYGASTKQKLNTTSSIEAELVFFLVLWMRYFLEAQGYSVSDNVVYQDNQS